MAEASSKSNGSPPPPHMAAIVSPSMAWMTVFFPALAYFIVTRLSGSGGSWGRLTELGEVVATTILVSSNEDAVCEKLSSIFHISSCKSSEKSAALSRTLNLVQSTGLDDVQASCWRHDTEAGRGYLLLSQSSGKGRVWRWEVGGGPIPIGKTLHLEASGCRSGKWRDCHAISSEGSTPLGSGGIAVDFLKQDHFLAGRLVVAEWGEGRVSRLEENGARTPLVIQIPNICNSNETAASGYKRLHAPSTLLYTPFGDLLLADYNTDCQRAALFRLRQAVQVTPLPSLAESRQAHNWTAVSHAQPLDVIFAPDNVRAIGGVALDASWTGIYLTAEQDGNVILYHSVLPGDDDADADESPEPSENGQERKPKTNLKQVLNLTQHLSERQSAGSVVVDGAGNIFLAISSGIAIVQADRGEIVGTLNVGARPRSLTLGEDGYLYLAMKAQLLRIPIKTRPLKIPTNLALPAKKAK